MHYQNGSWMDSQASLCEAPVGVKSFYLMCLLITGTPILCSELLSPLCPRSSLGDYFDTRRKFGFGGGRRYSIDGALKGQADCRARPPVL